MIRFYAPEIATTRTLPEVESGHCCRVLRMREGDHIHVVDGLGNSYECVITLAHHKHTSVEIVSCTPEEKHWKGRVTLAISPTKSIDRIEWLLEKAVEIGLDEIVFLKCEHSERKEVKVERIQRILVSAMKQSMKATLPRLTGMTDFRKFVTDENFGAKFMGYCSESVERREFVKSYIPGEDVCILIGPEGDFSPSEVEEALAAGVRPVTFGNTRLRTETAALYGLCAVHAIQDFTH